MNLVFEVVEMRSGTRSPDDNLLRVRSKLPSRGEGPSLFEQWGSTLEETGALLLIERQKQEILQNYLRCSAFEYSLMCDRTWQQLCFTITLQ